MEIFLAVSLVLLIIVVVILSINLASVEGERDRVKSQLNAYIKPNLVNIYPEIYNIIAAWCKEVGIYQVAIKTKYDSKSECYKLILYTERPGAFIGRAGSIIEKYKKMLQECRVGRMIEQIDIEEISGIVNQNQVDVEDYYNSYMANWFAYEEAGTECQSIIEITLQIQAIKK